MGFVCGGISDKGDFRENNEDSIFFGVRQAGDGQVCLALVCDGIGGLRDGEIAAGMITSHMQSWFNGFYSSRSFEDICKLLLMNINMINTVIYEKTQVEDIQTGSTLAALLLWGDRYFAANVGDSRIYLVSNSVSMISEDDVVTVNVGGTSRTRLSQCIGNSPNIYINNSSGDIDARTAFIVCSDGFYKRVTEAQMKKLCTHIKSEKDCIKNAGAGIAFVRQKGERDNVSCIIAKYIKSS